MRNLIRRLHCAAIARPSMLLAVLCLFVAACDAQYRFTQWTSDSGLPQNSVRGIVQTPDGYLWIATLNGLARFDGVRFQVFDKSNTPGISSSRFTAMVPGKNGDLWLASEDYNVIRVHKGMFQPLNEPFGIRPRSIGALTADRGHVWVESDGHVLQWNEQNNRFERASFSTDDLRFQSLRWTGTGFWALRGQQLICFDRGRLLQFAAPQHVKVEDIGGVVVNAVGEAWVGTRDGRLGKLGDQPPTLTRDSTTFQVPLVNNAWSVDITPPRFERKVHLPIGGVDHVVSMNALSADNEGNIWLGTEGEGLYRIQRQQIRVISAEQGLASNNSYPVFRSHSGEIWVGSWPGGLTEIRDDKVVRTIGKAEGLTDLISSLGEDQEGVLWIGTHGGLRIWKDGRISIPPISGSVPAVTQAIHQSPDGTMFFGTTRGVWIMAAGGTRHLSTADGLATDDVRTIITDRRGDQWIAGYGGVTRLHDGQLTHWTEQDGLPSNNVRTIMEDSAGAIWVGTYDGGIGWMRHGSWIAFNKKRGLFDNGAFQILEDGQSRFWISSNRGIYRIDRNQLEAVADGRESLVNSVAYGRADGLLSVECNGGLSPAGSKDLRGHLWFPTSMGVAVIDPGKMQVVNQPPRVVIESASVDHGQSRSSASTTILPGQTSLEIDYTALSHTKPEQITFRYKLEGVDDDWQKVGTRRTAYYTQLPPGSYTFRIQARNSDGVLSVDDARMSVVVIPPFYRRWWFIALAIGLFGLVMSSWWQYRIRELKRAQERQQNFSRQLIASQEGERRRIAGELHDSLGQRLIIINNLALFLLKAKGKIRTDEEKQQTMEEISMEAAAAIEETRAISYALRPFQLDRLGLTRAIQALCTSIERAAQVSVVTHLEDIDDAFPEDLRINVYRIIQEGLNNVVKHAEASTATVSAQRRTDAVILNIRDDGRGLPQKTPAPEPGQGGFGMTGMRERITLLHGTFHVESSSETGTLLTIHLPLSTSKVL